MLALIRMPNSHRKPYLKENLALAFTLPAKTLNKLWVNVLDKRQSLFRVNMAAVQLLPTELGKVQGPQLHISKTHLHLECETEKSQSEELVITNIGTTAVFYEWRKAAKGDYFKAKRSDPIVRFYCHYVSST